MSEPEPSALEEAVAQLRALFLARWQQAPKDVQQAMMAGLDALLGTAALQERELCAQALEAEADADYDPGSWPHRALLQGAQVIRNRRDENG